MKAYRFDIKISGEGIIKLPSNAGLSDKEAEVIILLKEDIRNKGLTGSDFINKWAGILKNQDIEQSKFNYLSEKYK